MSDVVAKIEQALEGATPGDWRWGGYTHLIDLRSNASGTPYVMGFKRHGMQGAQPTFPVKTGGEPDHPWHNGVMTNAADLVVKEVHYREDIVAIDNPNARLIAAAPTLLREALAEIRRLRGEQVDA